MIRFVEMECPNCGGNLQKTGEKTAKCSHCGAEFIIDEGQPKNVTNIYEAPHQAGHQKNIGAVIVFLVIFVLFAVLMMVSLVSRMLIRQQKSVNNSSVKEKYEMYQDAQGDERSEFFVWFAEKIYGFPFEDITAKQLAKLTELHIFWENDCTVAEYALEDGAKERIEIPFGLEVNYKDIRNFTGLKRLRLENVGLTTGYMDGLNELTEVWTSNSPKELAAIIPNPAQVTSLGCYDLTSVEGIDAFTNLEQLYVKDTDLSDIVALSALSHLKDLEIDRGDNITNFGVLNSLNGLERLAIESEGLKEVSFLQNMTHLKELIIEDSSVLDLSPLDGLTNLTVLCLDDNSEVTDYSVLETLTGLEILELDLGSGAKMPSAANWQNLKSLAVSGADRIDFLAKLPGLQSLRVSGSDCTNIDVLSALTNLESLQLSGIYGDIADLKVLNQLSGLKSLNLRSLSLYGNVEYIFGIPALEELNISDCSFGLDFAVMPENANLKRLFMSRLKVLENISVDYDGAVTYLDYDEVNLSDNIGFLSKFSNLEELYAQSDQLTGLEFTGNLPMLKKLDVTDNYITDLRPLEKLSNLETVWCGENSISQGNSLGEHVTVIMDSVAEEGLW